MSRIEDEDSSFNAEKDSVIQSNYLKQLKTENDDKRNDKAVAYQ